MLKVDHTVLKKFSSNVDKIRAEAHWFDHTPLPLRKFTPQYLGDGIEDGGYFYSIEYLGAIPLNESFVYGRQTVVFWERVFMKISSFLDASRSTDAPACAEGSRNEALFVRKAHGRLDDFIRQTGFDADSELVLNGVRLPSLRQILADSSAHLMALGDIPAFVHGDLCLSNILYDSRMRAIKLIDPRGVNEDGQRMIDLMGLPEAMKESQESIGEGGTRLSGGQRQRLAIARALYRKPQVLILDEATSAMDVHTQAHVLAVVSESMKGQTVLMITHRAETLSFCNKILTLPEGRLVLASSGHA